MKTRYYTATSLDGFIADEQNALDWLFQFGDTPPGDFAEFLAGTGAIAMGSTTYEWLLAHLSEEGGKPQPWPYPQAWPYSQPAWVFSSRDLPAYPGGDIRFARGDVAPVHQAMADAAAGKDIWILGGGDLAGQFHDQGLLDEIVVDIASVTLGAGAPLLPRTITSPPLRLLSVEAYGSGLARLVYEVSKAS
jgi:dihydrofolate reductase